jgi:hypothetical protein
MESIHGLVQLRKIQTLSVHECSKLEELEGLEHCI